MNVIAAGPTAEGVTRVPAKYTSAVGPKLLASDGDHAAAGQASRRWCHPRDLDVGRGPARARRTRRSMACRHSRARRRSRSSTWPVRRRSPRLPRFRGTRRTVVPEAGRIRAYGRPAAGQMLRRLLAGTSTVVVMPVPSSVAKMARTWMLTAAGLTTRKKLSKRRPIRPRPVALQRTPISIRVARCRQRHALPSTGKMGVEGLAADGVPQYTARSATMGIELSRRTENAVDGMSGAPVLSFSCPPRYRTGSWEGRYNCA